MDFKTVEETDGGVILKDTVNFELSHIFDCGQCFRWNRQENGSYTGTAFNRVIEINKEGPDVIIYNTNKEEFFSIWLKYFDLERDYSEIKKKLGEDPLLKVAVEFGQGIRLLQQEPFELLISFIISSNNRIPMIKRCIENISRRWGNKQLIKNYSILIDFN
jgi:N-glycosylase/DNA lyase